jgi:nucleotide-binding universal stress UspA family protein
MSGRSISSLPAVWDRVVCGIDGTPAGLEAAREVARLMPATARLTLCAVVDPTPKEPDKPSTDEAEDALERTRKEIGDLHDAEVRLREGPPVRLLLDELAAESATLVAVGSRGRSRARGIVLGSVATAMLHKAPCSILIASQIEVTDTSTHRELVVGFDGSDGARRALAVARELAERLSVKLRGVVATGGAMIAPELPWLAEDLEPDVAVTEDPRAIVDALADASASAGLLILGSRHLRGPAALSSVSERVAHHASGSVLVVR